MFKPVSIEKEFLNFQFLTPSKNAEKVDIYLSSLNEALENDDVINIAISGSYGAGKSSFIKTFETKNPQYTFLDISLASFKKEDKDLSLIEKSILQQIFYKVKQETVPFSRFKRITQIKHLKLKTILVLFLIFALLIFFDSKYINSLEFIQLLNSENLKIWNTSLLKLISFSTLLIGGFFLIRGIISSFTEITLDKLNLNNLEITTNKPNENSLLNKYLDEILYFFTETDYNVVVFQDLDRFDNIEIFTKLRELNNFINNSEQVNKKIVFLYAVKDEMFEEGDARTKFFDFMIPIIPYVNSSTSYDKLLEFFESDLKKLTKDSRDNFKDFLRDISLYIKDMRLLKNIYNEYKIYDKKIGRKLDKVKLLAIIVYKNFYPEDFSNLHKDKGIVFNVFKERNKYIKDIDEEYSKKIELLRTKIKNIENELIDDVKDLRKVYIFSIINKMANNPPYLRVNGDNMYFQDTLENEKFELIKGSTNIRNPNHNYNPISFADVEKEISEFSYNKREENILNKQNNTTYDLNSQIQKIKKIQKVLNTKTISELCILENMRHIISNDITDKKGLLKLLLLNGFIDENYYMFLSYSFEKSLTSSDTEFLKSVINSIGLDYDFNLTNLNEIVSKLRVNEFKKNAVLNFKLVGFLLENKTKFSKQFEVVFEQVVDGSEKSLEFIFDYIKILPKHNNFIIEVTNKWKGFWEYIHHSDFTLEEKEELFYLILTNITAKGIVTLNVNDTLKDYIENLNKIRKLGKIENSKIKELLKQLDIKFIELKKPILNEEIFEYIYYNNHYVLNKSMIELIIYQKYVTKKNIEKELEENHLTTILSLDKENKLIDRIEGNIESYINDIFLKIETNNDESEETIISLLNNDLLSDSIKTEIINSQKLIIQNGLKVTNPEILEVLVQKNKVESSWDNIHLIYSITNDLTKTVIDYLNKTSNAEKLSEIRINSKYCEVNKNFNTKFLKDILESNDINNTSYELLIKSNGYWYKDFDIQNIGEDKIDILLENGKLQLSRNNIEQLIKYSLSKHLVLIENLFDQFINEFDDIQDLLEEDDYIKLLETSNLKIEKKFDLMELISIESFNMNAEVSLLLWNLYVEKKEVMSFSLLSNILSFIPYKERLKVLISQLEFNSFSNDEIKELLDMFSSPFNELCLRIGSYEKLFNNDENLKLAEILKDSNCISSISVKNKTIRINRFRN
tara:strand:- start:5419 stop:9003 length:3585 start_codon:yes stop_codon:yes gene_type:complete